jgi:hypothetical protein
MDAFLAHGQELDASPTKYHANPFEHFATWVLTPIEPSSLSHHIHHARSSHTLSPTEPP